MTQTRLPNWSGRDDTHTEGPLALRWHQKVQPWHAQSAPGFTLVGFACDEGVRRNGGRLGAAGAPPAIRNALSNLAWHQTSPLFDAGDITCQQGDLKSAQEQLGLQLAALLKSEQRPIVMGGGHETAWGTFLGIMAYPPSETVGIINLDAHFDLRPSDKPHSGTPFAQMADWCHANSRPFHYLCLGIAEAANTAVLFQRADLLKANWIADEDLSLTRYQDSLSKIDGFIKQVDRIYLSIDLDVLPIATMSAVSAPAALGVPLDVVLQLVQRISSTGKLLAAEVVEYNPLLDRDQAGARVASRIIWQLTRHWAPHSETRA